MLDGCLEWFRIQLGQKLSRLDFFVRFNIDFDNLAADLRADS